MEPNAEALKFTGHERDTLPGGPLSLDYMHARYETGTLGRFLSMDHGSTHPDMPQSWNRYVYGGNNPITNVDTNGLEWRTFAKAAGVEKLMDMLAARSPGMRDTLALYDGPKNPDLRFEITDLSANTDGGNGGTFGKVKMSESDVSYDSAKMNQTGDPQEVLPFTGRFLTGATNYGGGTIELSNKLDLRVLPAISKETARVVFHEIGHADLAARNTLLYLKLTANDLDKNIPKHDDREVEKQANQYSATRCHESKLCPDQ
jgi:RHS repeat-associated protein